MDNFIIDQSVVFGNPNQIIKSILKQKSYQTQLFCLKQQFLNEQFHSKIGVLRQFQQSQILIQEKSCMQRHYHQLFATACQPHLLQKQFEPTNHQLEQATHSLIEKHKLNNGIQQLLLCRNNKSNQDELASTREKNMIEQQRKKYIDFVRKNYSQKITDQLTSVGKLRNRIKEFQQKNQTEKRRVVDEKDGKGLMEQQIRMRSKNVEEGNKRGNKKVKVDQTAKPKESKKKKIQEKQQKVIVPSSPPNLIDHPSQQMLSESLDLELLNSLDEDDLQHYQDDE